MNLTEIKNTVQSGKVVMSADDNVVFTAVKAIIKSGLPATFYVTKKQYKTIMRWYWNPKRIKEVGLVKASSDELSRIKKELGIEIETLYSNQIEMDDGEVYGGFEFIKQGIEEHGRQMVEQVFNVKDIAVIQVNIPNYPLSSENRLLPPSGVGHYYWMWKPDYGCCLEY